MRNKKSIFTILTGLLIANLLVSLLFIIVPRVSAATGCFPDTNDHWAEEFICWMSDQGLVGGYPDGTFKPNNQVTRAELSVITSKTYDLAEANDDDTLGDLSCTTDQIAKWNGSAWECRADETGSGGGSDTLADLSCTTDQIAKWNGSAWECAADVDTDTNTDTLAGLSCSTDEIAKFDGSDWVCQPLSDYYTKSEVDSLISALESRVSAVEGKTASISTENGGDDVVFTSVNVHVRDGSGDTYGDVNGLGNLIVGYNEDNVVGGTATRTGSHNLVLGAENEYTSYGGFVAGYLNTISGAYSSISGGRFNTASGDSSSVSGGIYNTASGYSSSVSGGLEHTASGFYSSVSGGYDNTASGDYSSISGGYQRSVSGNYDWRAGTLFEDN